MVLAVGSHYLCPLQIDDLAQLKDLDEATLLSSLKDRFKADKIYVGWLWKV